MAVKDQLKAKRDKRNLGPNPEPSGGSGAPSKGPIFVIQKHGANRLHYDLRLEIDGVLSSWAVPKGPSMNPRDKRLAIPTDDHSIEYAEFEGLIPEGEYGAGTVLVWDLGTYHNLRIQGDRTVPMVRGLAEGHLIFWLEGKKLRGGYALHRFKEGEEESWLLIKLDDEEASRNHDPVKMQPESVLSGRILEEIAEEG